MALIQAVVVLALARGLGADIHLGLSLLAALPLVLLLVLMAHGLAFAIAGFARTAQGANQLNTFLGTPLLLLSGGLYPIAAFPHWLQLLVEYANPYAAVPAAVRGILFEPASPGDLSREVGVGAAWLVVAFLLAIRAYRFTER